MADIKWIKITTDMFDNRKIKHLRKLPDGNNIVLIWVMLLTMAGRCNAGGMIFLTENIPYTPKMLADELDFEENTVRLALEALEQLDMIRRNGFLTITGWDEYQNTDGMERIREQTRLRVAKHREMQKQLPSNVTCNVTVTQSNAAEEDIEREEDTEKEVSPPISPPLQPKRKRKQSEFVPPTLEEVERYAAERNSTVDPKQFWEFFKEGKWIDSKGNPVRNWKQKLLTWEKYDMQRGSAHPAQKTAKAPGEYKGDDFIEYLMEGKDHA